MFISTASIYIWQISNIYVLPNAQTCREPQPSLEFYWGKSQAKEVQELGLLLMKMTRQTCKFLTISSWTKSATTVVKR